jgi:hypothetical protein
VADLVLEILSVTVFAVLESYYSTYLLKDGPHLFLLMSSLAVSGPTLLDLGWNLQLSAY